MNGGKPWQPETLKALAYRDSLGSTETNLHLCLRSVIRARNTADHRPNHSPRYTERIAEANRLIAKAARLLDTVLGA